MANAILPSNTVTSTTLLSKVVIIGYVWPEPNSSAAGSRMMQLIKYLQLNSQQVIFASPALLSVHRIDLPAIGVEEHSITLNCESFDHWINEIQPELVIFDRFMMEEQFGWRIEQQCPSCIRILNTEDLHSLREARAQRVKKSLANGQEFDSQFNDFKALYQDMASTDICQREIAAILRSDLTLMISNIEIDLLQSAFNVPQHLLVHLPFMLDPLADNCIQKQSFEERTHFVTIGNFRHQPNWDSVLWLKKAIWPLIRKALPKAQMHIYGAYPAKKVTDLHNPQQGFYIQGWAEDAHQVLASAKVCLAPLRFGAGIKGKFTDAMQCSTPIVTTPVGSEAMHDQLPWPGAIQSDSNAIAQSAIALYQDSEYWQLAAQKSRPIIEQLYNRQQLEARLTLSIKTLQNDLTKIRLQNFSGMMLRHHHHKSTKYMAQWIAAKNAK